MIYLLSFFVERLDFAGGYPKNNFVVFLVHKGASGVGFMGPLVKTSLSDVPQEDYTVPFGKIKIY